MIEIIPELTKKAENCISQGLDILSVFENTGNRQGFVAWLDQANTLEKEIETSGETKHE